MVPSAMERSSSPTLDPDDWPVYQKVEKDAVYLLTKRMAIPLKAAAAQLPQTTANYVTSVSKLSRFLAEKAEEAGRLHPHRDGGRQAPGSKDRIVRGNSLRRQGSGGGGGRERRGAQQLRARVRSDGQGHPSWLKGRSAHLTQCARRLLRSRR